MTDRLEQIKADAVEVFLPTGPNTAHCFIILKLPDYNDLIRELEQSRAEVERLRQHFIDCVDCRECYEKENPKREIDE